MVNLSVVLVTKGLAVDRDNDRADGTARLCTSIANTFGKVLRDMRAICRFHDAY